MIVSNSFWPIVAFCFEIGTYLEKPQTEKKVPIFNMTYSQYYTGCISNVALYKRAGVPPLRCDVAKARLQFLRKMLLKPTTHPAY
jgi:hypothetical protein